MGRLMQVAFVNAGDDLRIEPLASASCFVVSASIVVAHKGSLVREVCRKNKLTEMLKGLGACDW